MFQPAAHIMHRCIPSLKASRAFGTASFAIRSAPELNLGSFDVNFGSSLGHGAFGDVFQGDCRATGTAVAIKTMSPVSYLVEEKRMSKADIANGIEDERDLFSHLLKDNASHPHVVDLIGYFQGPASEAKDLGMDLPSTALDEPLHYFVMELLEGKSLQDYIEESKGLPEEQVKVIARAICKGLEFLHKRGVVHRDIKPGNVHFAAKSSSIDASSLKLIDFSTAGVAPSGTSIESNCFQDLVGTMGYIAPEMMLAEKTGNGYSAKCDVFSLGCTIYAMLKNMRLPHRHPRLGIIMGNLDDCLSEEGQDFLNSLLAYRPENRPTLAEALRHPWLSARDVE